LDLRNGKETNLCIFSAVTNAEFTLNGFDDLERNLTFVKTVFQMSQLKFHACNFKQAFYPLHKLYNMRWSWQYNNIFTWLLNLHL